MSPIDNELRDEIERQPFWYHTIDLEADFTTPGLFDLREPAARLPWPDVRGKRCIDIGTFDGFFAFELEKRGAAEVIAIDVPKAELYDWPADVRPGLAERSALERQFHPPANGQGFALAASALGSNAHWKPLSIYDLDPVEAGTFDVAVCSSLLLHLRDPIRALEAIRTVCTGEFMSFEPIDLWLTLLHPRRPLARFDGMGLDCQWWTPNGRGQLRMMDSAGFSVQKVDRPMMVPFNRHAKPGRTLRRLVHQAMNRAATGSSAPGVLQRAVVARPAL